ncbi:hypothetical protein [Paenibacillus odorifer]|uniref:hypothetical protein n=1 Tax=Paenibacillus TaxID=44249 RepID=UPI00096C344C|nr:hypothetical protein [Paenibacillus odorifer]OME37856.1 hypothetical protein BSK46_14085 [Paenibacillus odorifer]OME42750.1 hypothetical protein BSK58_11415 [Paenibacillus odorifer]
MTEDQKSKNERNVAFKRFIEEHKETVREISDAQPKTIKPDDEWATEHEWTEMYTEMSKEANKDN